MHALMYTMYPTSNNSG